MNSVFDRQNNQISSIGDVAYIVKHFLLPGTRNRGTGTAVLRRSRTVKDAGRKFFFDYVRLKDRSGRRTDKLSEQACNIL